jgi:cellulose biosynthesis protein BcsQ
MACTKQKGGVGNTTQAVNVAAEAARLGAKVLLIDLDPQRNSTILTGTLPFEGNADQPAEPSLTELLRGEVKVSDVILLADDAWQPRADLPFEHGGQLIPGGALYVLPATHSLRTATRGSMMPHVLLYNAIRPVVDQFDLVVLDLRPATDELVLTALYAAGWWVTTTEPETLSVQGLLTQHDFLEAFRAEQPDHPGRWAGTVISRVDTRYDEHAARIADIHAWITQTHPERRALDPDLPAIVLPTVGGIWAPVIPERAAIKKSNRLPARPISASLHPLGDPSSPSLTVLGIKRSVVPIVPVLTSYAMNALRLAQTPALYRIAEFATTEAGKSLKSLGILERPTPIHSDLSRNSDPEEVMAR